MRLAFEASGCECVFSSDWDKYAQKTYEADFGELPKGNIREINAADIPDHNILVAGFPCQPFSISGVSKKNSLLRPHGFDDKTQGTLFFEIVHLLRDATQVVADADLIEPPYRLSSRRQMSSYGSNVSHPR